MPNVHKELPTVAIVLPHLQAGGIEKAAVRLFNHLHGKRLNAIFLLGSNNGPLLDELLPEIPVIVLKGGRAIRSVPNLSRVLAKHSVDAVYSGTNARNIATLLAVRLMKARDRPAVIISEHTSPQAYLAGARMPRARRRLMRALYPRADLLLTPTEGLGATWLKSLGLTRPAVATQPNPILDRDDVDLAQQIAAGRGPERDPDLVLSIGRLHPAKGHDVLLNALADALRQRPRLRLVILGEGENRGALDALACDLGIAAKVQMPGYTSQVADMLARAGLVVVPSRREGFGNVVVEALSLGAPVLATDCAGPRQILAETGADGRLVPVDDIKSLADGIVEMTGRAAGHDAAICASRHLIARYSVPAAAEEFADRLEQVLRGYKT